MAKRKRKRPADPWACPSWLGDDGKAEWGRIIGRLRVAGVLDETEPPAVETYCRAYETWRAAEAWIAENGMVAVTRNDKGEVQRVAAVPHVGISGRAFTQMRHFLADCGLTPKAAAGVTGSSGGADEPETVEETRQRIIRGIVG